MISKFVAPGLKAKSRRFERYFVLKSNLCLCVLALWFYVSSINTGVFFSTSRSDDGLIMTTLVGRFTSASGFFVLCGFWVGKFLGDSHHHGLIVVNIM